MARKKIIFFIVEGISDSTALSYALETIFNKSEVIVRVTEGDITSDSSTTTNNVIIRIVDEIKKEFGRSVKASDFLEVIQLVDTDGVFIDKSKVIFDNSKKVHYGDGAILCNNVPGIVNRNMNKSQILKKLISVNKVWKTIPYSIYFFSSNLDHVLHNDANLDPSLKVDKAVQFAKKYKNDIDGFIRFFSDEGISVNATYRESWALIMDGINSLKRLTNFQLLFTDQAKNPIGLDK